MTEMQPITSLAALTTEQLLTQLKEPVHVEVAFQKFRVTDVRVEESTFSAVFSLHLRWLDPTLSEEDKAKSKAWDAGWTPPWTPKVDFVNEMETIECFRANYDTDPQGHVRMFARYRGRFHEPFELQRFPFDRHYLNIRISTTWPVQVMTYVPRENYQNTIETTALAAWTIPPDPLDVFIDPLPDKPTRYNFSKCSLRCKIERSYQFYTWNIALVFFLINFIALYSMLFDAEALNDRLSVTITLLLTIVAFKFAINASLPAVPYFTMFDKYVLSGFAFLFLISMENAIVRVLSVYGSKVVDAKDVDVVCLYVFAGYWFLFHLTCFTLLLFRRESFYKPWTALRSPF